MITQQWIDDLRAIGPTLADEVEAAEAEWTTARQAAHEADKRANDAAARLRELHLRHAKAVEEYRRDSTIPPGVDAAELMPLFQWRKPGPIRVSRPYKLRGKMAVDVILFEWFGGQWKHAEVHDVWITGIPIGKRKPVITPERLRQLWPAG